MVAVAQMPNNQRALLQGTNINASKVLQEIKQSFTTVICKWTEATLQNTLLFYSKEPSTYAMFKPKENTPSNKKNQTSHNNLKRQSPSGPASGGNGSWGCFGDSTPTNQASDPTKGLIEAVNNMSLCTSPRLTNNTKACHNFICKGCSCLCGHACAFVHVSLRPNHQANVYILQRWAEATNGITWIAHANNMQGSSGRFRDSSRNTASTDLHTSSNSIQQSEQAAPSGQ
jgi:hypothetical protein